MRKMHQSVLTSYMNLMLLVVMIAIVYGTGSDLTPWANFSAIDWVLLFGLSASNVGSQTFRFKAIQLSPVSRLQPLTFT